MVSKPALFSRISLPVKVGLVCALLAMLLAVVGIARGVVPANPLSIFLALLISGGSWFVVSWAVTTAAVDVESDLAEAAAEPSAQAAGSQLGTPNDKG
jgi:arginine exporter protein ArgO